MSGLVGYGSSEEEDEKEAEEPKEVDPLKVRSYLGLYCTAANTELVGCRPRRIPSQQLWVRA